MSLFAKNLAKLGNNKGKNKRLTTDNSSKLKDIEKGLAISELSEVFAENTYAPFYNLHRFISDKKLSEIFDVVNGNINGTGYENYTLNDLFNHLKKEFIPIKYRAYVGPLKDQFVGTDVNILGSIINYNDDDKGELYIDVGTSLDYSTLGQIFPTLFAHTAGSLEAFFNGLTEEDYSSYANDPLSFQYAYAGLCLSDFTFKSAKNPTGTDNPFGVVINSDKNTQTIDDLYKQAVSALVNAELVWLLSEAIHGRSHLVVPTSTIISNLQDATNEESQGFLMNFVLNGIFKGLTKHTYCRTTNLYDPVTKENNLALISDRITAGEVITINVNYKNVAGEIISNSSTDKSIKLVNLVFTNVEGEQLLSADLESEYDNIETLIPLELSQIIVKDYVEWSSLYPTSFTTSLKDLKNDSLRIPESNIFTNTLFTDKVLSMSPQLTKTYGHVNVSLVGDASYSYTKDEIVTNKNISNAEALYAVVVRKLDYTVTQDGVDHSYQVIAAIPEGVTNFNDIIMQVHGSVLAYNIQYSVNADSANKFEIASYFPTLVQLASISGKVVILPNMYHSMLNGNQQKALLNGTVINEALEALKVPYGANITLMGISAGVMAVNNALRLDELQKYNVKDIYLSGLTNVSEWSKSPFALFVQLGNTSQQILENFIIGGLLLNTLVTIYEPTALAAAGVPGITVPTLNSVLNGDGTEENAGLISLAVLGASRTLGFSTFWGFEWAESTITQAWKDVRGSNLNAVPFPFVVANFMEAIALDQNGDPDTVNYGPYGIKLTSIKTYLETEINDYMVNTPITDWLTSFGPKMVEILTYINDPANNLVDGILGKASNISTYTVDETIYAYFIETLTFNLDKYPLGSNLTLINYLSDNVTPPALSARATDPTYFGFKLEQSDAFTNRGHNVKEIVHKSNVMSILQDNNLDSTIYGPGYLRDHELSWIEMTRQVAEDLYPNRQSDIDALSTYTYVVTAGAYQARVGARFSADKSRVRIYNHWDNGLFQNATDYVKIGKNVRNQNVYVAGTEQAVGSHTNYTLIGLSVGLGLSGDTMVASYVVFDDNLNLITVHIGTTLEATSAYFSVLARPTLINVFAALGMPQQNPPFKIDTRAYYEAIQNSTLDLINNPGSVPNYDSINPGWSYDLTLPIIDQLPGVRSIHFLSAPLPAYYVMLNIGLLVIIYAGPENTVPTGLDDADGNPIFLAPGSALGQFDFSSIIGRAGAYGYRNMGLTNDDDASNSPIVFIGNTSTDYHGAEQSFLEDNHVRSGSIHAVKIPIDSNTGGFDYSDAATGTLNISSSMWSLESMPSYSGQFTGNQYTVNADILRPGEDFVLTDVPLTDGHKLTAAKSFEIDGVNGHAVLSVPIAQTTTVDGVETITGYTDYNFAINSTDADGDYALDFGSTYTGTNPDDTNDTVQKTGQELVFVGNRLGINRYERADLEAGTVTSTDTREFASWGGSFWQVGNAPVTTMTVDGINDVKVVAFTQGGGAGKLPKFIVDRQRKKMDPLTGELIRIQVASMENDLEGGRTRALALLNEMKVECEADPMHYNSNAVDPNDYPYTAINIHGWAGQPQQTLLQNLIASVTNAITWSIALQQQVQDYIKFCAALGSEPRFMSPYEKRINMCGMMVLRVDNGEVVMISRESQPDQYHYPGFIAVDVANPADFTSFEKIYKSTSPWAQKLLTYYPGYNGDYGMSAKLYEENGEKYLIGRSKLHVVAKVKLQQNVTAFTTSSAEWTTPTDYNLLEYGSRCPVWSTGAISGTFRDEIENGILYTANTHFSPANMVVNGVSVHRFQSQILSINLAGNMSFMWQYAFPIARGSQAPVYVPKDANGAALPLVLTADAFGDTYVIDKTNGALLHRLDATDVDRQFESRLMWINGTDANVGQTILAVFGGGGWTIPNAADTTDPSWPSETLANALATPDDYGLIVFDVTESNGAYTFTRRAETVKMLLKNKRLVYDPYVNPVTGNIGLIKSALAFDASNVLSINPQDLFDQAGLVGDDGSSSLTEVWVYPPQAA